MGVGRAEFRSSRQGNGGGGGVIEGWSSVGIIPLGGNCCSTKDGDRHFGPSHQGRCPTTDLLRLQNLPLGASITHMTFKAGKEGDTL